MALKRIIFDVYLAPIGGDGKPDFDAEPIEFLGVQVRHGDQLRAELEGAKNGLPNITQAPTHGASLWAWASLVRTKDYGSDYRTFKAQAIAVQGVGSEDVDPTQPAAPSEPGSPSPATSEAGLPTGSTPS